MITKAQYNAAVQQATRLYKQTGVSLRDDEYARMEVADFGLGEVTADRRANHHTG